MRLARDLILMVAIAVILAALALIVTQPSPVGACERVSRQHPDYLAGWNPTRWRGCTIYGTGTASTWDGPGVARNDCLWPWTACAPITITSHAGRSLTVAPTMFCDCYTHRHSGRYRERLVDLDPAALHALGLDGRGLYPVAVAPADRTGITGSAPPADTLPDTATR